MPRPLPSPQHLVDHRLHILLRGTGREAKDAAFSTIFGSAQMTHMQIDVVEHEPRQTADSGWAVLEQAAVGSA